MSAKKKALIYCRVSSERQKKEGHGLESQEHRCREYARQKGYDIEMVFKDSFTGSGDFMKRPAMRNLLEYVSKSNNKGFVVIFDDLKRFARDLEFHLKLRSVFKARGLKPECLNFSFDSSPAGRFAENVMAAHGEMEREENRIQVIQKQKARLENGYFPFFPPPGYVQKKTDVHGKLLTPVEPDASIIKEALEGFASGRFETQSDVMNFLNEKGFRGGKRTYLETTKRLLTRCIYAGYIEYPNWSVSRRKGHHKPLISLETFEKIQQKLERKPIVRTRKDFNPDFPLRGFAVCATCRDFFTASWSTGRSTKYPYYRCRNHDCLLHNKSIAKDAIETDFELLLKEIQPKEEAVKVAEIAALDVWSLKKDRMEAYKSKSDAELRGIQKEIDSLLQRVSKNAGNERLVSTYEKRIEELTEKEQLLKEKLHKVGEHPISFETALEEVFGFIKSPYVSWINGDYNDKKGLKEHFGG